MKAELPQAVAVVIVHEARYLLICRARAPFPGWWCPVSGRVEPGESLAEAAVREAEEEMGLQVTVGSVFFVCPTTDESHELHFLPARWIGGDPRPDPREVQEWGWFSLEEAHELEPVFEADLVALALLERLKIKP